MNAGAMTYDQAYSTLAEDFGEDFVKMIQVVASHAGEQGAGPAVSMLQQSVEQAISNLDDERMRMHFERIYEAHPDFVEITDSPQFVAWLEQNPDYKPVVESGSADPSSPCSTTSRRRAAARSDIPERRVRRWRPVPWGASAPAWLPRNHRWATARSRTSSTSWPEGGNMTLKVKIANERIDSGARHRSHWRGHEPDEHVRPGHDRARPGRRVQHLRGLSLHLIEVPNGKVARFHRSCWATPNWIAEQARIDAEAQARSDAEEAEARRRRRRRPARD